MAMTAERVERRLAAILAADEVGYTQLMERDEDRTLKGLKALRRELIDPLVADCRGRLVKLMGDGTLVEFASVVDAVRCALLIQAGVAEREATAAGTDGLRFRIGINLGDVIREADGDLYGDGVNVAARLQQIAEPGGVVVSGTAYDHLAGKLDCRLVSLGLRKLKNIERSMRVYKVSGAAAEPSAGPPAGPGPGAERPSVAVLPFVNMSPDPDQDYFSDGIADDLITDLAKISGLFVAARQPAFAFKGTGADVFEVGARLGSRYVLEGSVRRAGDRVRITAQLADTATGGHLWAERYDRVLTDVFAVQDDITRSIVAALRVRLLPGEESAFSSPPTGDMDAYHLYLRGRQLFYQRTEHGYGLARRLFAQAVEIDPRFARAQAGVAECDASLYLHYGARLPLEDILARADAALALEPGLAAAHVVRGLVLVAQARIEEAEAAFVRATELDPENDNAHYCHARACFQQGRMEDAARLFRRAAALFPDDIYAPLTLIGVERGLGRTEQARTAAQLTRQRAERKLEGNPEDPHAAYAVASALAVLDDPAGAARWAARALALAPDDHTTQYNVACVYAVLGEVERALDLLERTMPSASAHRQAWMARDHDFDPLRLEPRFQALQRRLEADA
jgi:adenylate cyclase